MVHPVVVVTTCSTSARYPWKLDEKYQRHSYLSPFYVNFCAATVSSFTTVSLGPPYPMVSFNLKRPSRTLDGILEHSFFRVCILRANQQGANVASAFIKGDHAGGFKKIAEQQHWVGFGEPKSIWHLAQRPSRRPFGPVIDGAGVYSQFLCEVETHKCVEVGDHTIVVAKVMEVEQRESDQTATLGLSYAQGRFRGSSRGIDVVDESTTDPTAQSDRFHFDIVIYRTRQVFRNLVTQCAAIAGKSKQEGKTMESLIFAAIYELVEKQESIDRKDLLFACTAVAFDLVKRLRDGDKALPLELEMSPVIELLTKKLKEGVRSKVLHTEWGLVTGRVAQTSNGAVNKEAVNMSREELHLCEPKQTDELQSMTSAARGTATSESTASRQEEESEEDGETSEALEENSDETRAQSTIEDSGSQQTASEPEPARIDGWVDGEGKDGKAGQISHGSAR